MKSIFISFAAMMLLLAPVTGCKDEETKTIYDQQIQSFGGKLISHTDCKTFQKSFSLMLFI